MLTCFIHLSLEPQNRPSTQPASYHIVPLTRASTSTLLAQIELSFRNATTHRR